MISFTKRNLPNVIALFSFIVGILVITGWVFHIPTLTSLLPGAIPARMNAGVCFLLSGIVLFLLNTKYTIRKKQVWILTGSVLILLTGLLTFTEYVSGKNFGIDALLYTPAASLPANGRMSLPASITFAILGLTFLLLPRRRYHLFIHVTNILIILSGLLTLLDYLSGTVYFEKLLQFYSSSPITGMLFILLCTGIHYSIHMDYLQVSFQKKIAGFLLLVFLVLGFFFFTIEKNNDKISATARLVDKTDEIISLSEVLHTEIEVMQNGLKNFLILKKDNFLNDYNTVIATINRHLDSLGPAAAVNTSLLNRIDSMKRLLNDYTISRRVIINMHYNPGLTEEKVKEVIDEGKLKMDEVRAHLLDIKKTEGIKLSRLKVDKYFYLQKLPNIIRLSQFFTLLFLLMALYMIYRNSRSRDKAENALDKSEKFLKAIIGNSNNPIAIRDLSGRYLMVNSPVEQLTKLPREKVTGKTLWDLHPKAMADAAKSADDEVVKTKRALIQEISVPINEEMHTYSVSRFPIYDEHNTIYAIGTIATDITGINRANELLKEYMHFFHNSNDLCVIATINGEFEKINPVTLATLGYAENEITGKSFIDFVHPDDILFIIKEIEKSKTKQTDAISFSRRFLKKDGEFIWISWKAIPNPATGKIYAVGRDITDQKALETKLKQFNTELEIQVEEKTKLVLEKEHQYRFLLESMHEGIQLIDYGWRYLFVNKALVAQSHYTDEKDLVGFTVMEKYPGVENTELFQILDRCMNERQPAIVENYFIFPNGDKGWFELSIQPVPEGIFILSVDITSRKKAEEKISNYTEELKRSNTELERFAYVASHDLQEPLRMVSSFMNLLARKLDGQLDDTAKQYMHYAVDGADRMKSLIHDLLEYSRIGTHKENFVLVDPVEVMNYVIRVMDEEIQQSGASVHVKSMPAVMASKTLFSQLLVNLVSNALKYNGGKTPEIEVGCKEETGEFIFYVQDNGEGIDSKFFEKIFIIFQRLHNKGEYSGTGIGLAICKKIVDAHKGKIWVESEKGSGSTFYFTIPKSVL